MVQNKKGGSRYKKAKKYGSTNEKIIMRDENLNEHYAYVSRAYGNGQFGVFLVEQNNDGMHCLTEKEFRGRLSGKMRRRKSSNFVRANDLVLISKRDFQTNDEKVDILHVYKHDVVKKLAKMGHVPIIENLQDAMADGGNTVVFAYEDADETKEKETSINTDSNDSSAPASDWQIDVDDI